MLQPFDLQGGPLLAAARAAAVAGLLSVLGALVFRVVVMPQVLSKLDAPDAARVTRVLLIATQASIAFGSLAAMVWLIVQAASITSARSVHDVLTALPTVAAHTRFGHLILLQLALLTAASGCLGRRDAPTRQRLGLGLASAALALQAGHSHAAAMFTDTPWLLAFDLLHLAGAGAWLGGLLPLLLVVHVAPAKAAATAARRCSPLGKLCIAALVLSATGQSWVLVGSLAGLVGTAYGWLLLIKLGLFALLLGFAAANRYRFAPALLQPDPAPGRRVLVRSIAVQSCVGLAVVTAAAVLSNLPPAMHIQPVWPFADRFSLATVNEDVDFRNEALAAVLALAGAAVLLAAAIVMRRRLSWALAVGAIAIGWFAVPHLDLLFVPAYPTSYYHSPTGFAAASILDGAALYPAHCAACHGADGRGDGVAARSLPVPPADLTAPHLWMHSDGELFWWLANGMTAPDGHPAMPGFATLLSDDQRWHLIDFIRARNAGLAFHATGRWPAAVAAPDLQVTCAGGRATSLADLRGGLVRLVIGPAAAMSGVTTVLLGGHAGSPVAPGLCTADDVAAGGAYAIAGGLPAGQAQDAAFLVDRQGLLRLVQEGQPGWNDLAALAAAIARLKAAPPVPAMAGTMPMNMKM